MQLKLALSGESVEGKTPDPELYAFPGISIPIPLTYLTYIVIYFIT